MATGDQLGATETTEGIQEQFNKLFDQPGAWIDAQLRRYAEPPFSEPGEGVTRRPHSRELLATQLDLIEQAQTAGIEHVRDAFGNLYFILRPESLTTNRVVLSGSHLDSVPRGGRYDGASGSLTAFHNLLAIKRRIDAEQLTLTAPLVVVMYDNEESAVTGQAYEGSTAAFGRIGEDRLLFQSPKGPEDYHNKTMASLAAERNQAYLQAMREKNLTVPDLPTSEEAVIESLQTQPGIHQVWDALGLSAEQVESLELVHLESHIQQSDQLNAARGDDPTQKRLEIITRISEPFRETLRFEPNESPSDVKSEGKKLLRVELTGEWNHSGATPMAERQDVLVRFAHWYRGMDQETRAQVHVADIRAPEGQSFAQTKVPGGAMMELLVEEAQVAQIMADLSSLPNTEVTQALPARETYAIWSPEALLAATETMVQVTDRFTRIDAGADNERNHMRATFGIIERTEDGGVNLRLDVRNASGESRPNKNSRLRRQLMKSIRSALSELRDRVGFRFERGLKPLARAIRSSAPVNMSADLMQQAHAHAEYLGITLQEGVSYPGHDVSNVTALRARAGQTIHSLLAFLPSQHGSHNPHEFATSHDLGTMAEFMRSLTQALLTEPAPPDQPPTSA